MVPESMHTPPSTMEGHWKFLWGRGGGGGGGGVLKAKLLEEKYDVINLELPGG